MDKLLNPCLEEHHVKADIHQLVGAHDGLGVLNPTFQQGTSRRFLAAEYCQVLFFLGLRIYDFFLIRSIDFTL